MHELPSDATVEARLREHLAGELRRAETDYPRLDVVRARPRIRSRRPIGVALAAVAVLLLAGAFVVPRLVGPGIGGPAAIPIGDDGLPLSIAGEPVRRLDVMALWTTDRDYLVGGTLVLNTGRCLSRSERAQFGCGEDWMLVSGPPKNPTASVTLDSAPAAAGFVRTSGALTVIRVGDPSPVAGALTVTSVAWRKPTKGRIPDNATPPEGGMTNEALVPDFVSYVGSAGDTVLGYVPKDYPVGGPEPLPGTPSDPPQDLRIPVYGEDLVTLVGHDVPGVGFVALGATETPSPREFSEAPATEAPVVEAPLPATPSPSDAGPVLDCGRIDPITCARAVDLARAVDQGEVTNVSRIIVDDTCPPQALCDRLYPFDSLVVFVTAGADTTGWISFSVTGLEYNAPTDASRYLGDLPAHVVSRVAASATSSAAPFVVVRFDVMNRSGQAVVMSVASDAGADMPGFLPGESGTVYIPVRTAASEIQIEVLSQPNCVPSASASYSLGFPFTLLIDDGATARWLVLGTDPGIFTTPKPLPVNSVHCPGG